MTLPVRQWLQRVAECVQCAYYVGAVHLYRPVVVTPERLPCGRQLVARLLKAHLANRRPAGINSVISRPTTTHDQIKTGRLHVDCQQLKNHSII